MTATAITPELVAEHGLKPDEYDRLLEIMGREPSITELGIFSVMWSEHCSYKSSRFWLKTLPTSGPQVIQGPGENAGIVDLGDGDCAVFKMESHNHPSYIEPYQGAATGVGGIMRDVFTMGARPIANLNALRFGDPSHPKTRHLVSGVVAGIGGYGNCVEFQQLAAKPTSMLLIITTSSSTLCAWDWQRLTKSSIQPPRAWDCPSCTSLKNRARRHPWRHDGIGRIRR